MPTGVFAALPLPLQEIPATIATLREEQVMREATQKELEQERQAAQARAGQGNVEAIA